ncbi:MAG: DUF4861 family protein [Hymenobacter sp.]|nr:DUF4861 family protein [Hymenobacter sp.]
MRFPSFLVVTLGLPLTASLLGLTPPAPQRVSVTVRNRLSLNRGAETVSLPATRLAALLRQYGAENLLVRDEAGNILVSQAVDNNGDGRVDELLFQTDIKANATQKFTVSGARNGASQQPKSPNTTFSRLVPERIDDYTWENDRVYLSDAGDTFKAYFPSELKRFVALGDTVVAARDVVVATRRFPFTRRRPRLIPAAFGRQLFRGGGFQLLSYDPARPATLTSALSSRLLLRRGQEAWQVLPANPAKFNRLMLALLGSDPALAAGLRAGQYRPRRDAARLLEQYADWQTRQFLQSVARPAH